MNMKKILHLKLPSTKGSLLDLSKAWKDSWVQTLKSNSFSSDLPAGLTVAATALPLNVALAVASGLPPIAGLVAGAVGGGVAALMGGSSLQVTGPAAALSTMVLALAVQFGIAGVAFGCLMIGAMQMAMSYFRLGKVINHVPESVLAGFITGVGLKLIDGQVPKLLGLKGNLHEHIIAADEWQWLHTISWHGVVCGLIVALFVISMRSWQKVPASLLAIGLVTTMSSFFNWNLESVGVIPSVFPSPAVSWVDPSVLGSLFLACVPLALLAGVESLISAKAVERASKGKPFHENLELMGQGLANIASGLFGGMPVSGVIVRSSVNVQSGGKTRISALFHAILLAVAVIHFSAPLGMIPLAALAGLLCVVGIRLVDGQTFAHLFKTDRIGAIAFAVAAWGTVSGHLMSGVIIGLLIHFAGVYMVSHSKANGKFGRMIAVIRPSANIRAVLEHDTTGGHKRVEHLPTEVKAENWLQLIRQQAQVHSSAFIHHRASVTGRVILGQHVHIAAESSVRADEGSPFFIGDNSNVQDGVVMHALKDQWVHVEGEPWAIYVGRNVSLAHQALIHGPCYIGDNSFVGFKAVVHDSIVGNRCYIGIGAVVVGVEVPEGRYVPHGKIVDTQEIADALPEVSNKQLVFNDDVVEVNRGLAAAYHENKISVRSRSTVHAPGDKTPVHAEKPHLSLDNPTAEPSINKLNAEMRL